jgi:hypothetical protein
VKVFSSFRSNLVERVVGKNGKNKVVDNEASQLLRVTHTVTPPNSLRAPHFSESSSTEANDEVTHVGLELGLSGTSLTACTPRNRSFDGRVIRNRLLSIIIHHFVLKERCRPHRLSTMHFTACKWCANSSSAKSTRHKCDISSRQEGRVQYPVYFVYTTTSNIFLPCVPFPRAS